MNQKCFYCTGSRSVVADYINALISNGWRIVTVSLSPNRNQLEDQDSFVAIIVGEIPTFDLQLNKK